MSNLINLTLLTISLVCCTINGQLMNYENYQRMPALGRGPMPKQQNRQGAQLKPARTVADVAEEYWIANKCVYPPRAFFSMFRDGCDVRLKAETFYAGICHAFFNSSKSLCTLDEATEDETQTLLSLHQLQETIEDDALCDTLAGMRNNDPSLFPQDKDFTKKEKWFSLISSLIFSPDTCAGACGMKNLHPICFGYMLNYNYIEAMKNKKEESEKENSIQENEENSSDEDEAEDEENEQNKTQMMEENKNSSTMLQDSKDQDDDFDAEGAGSDVILSEVLKKNPELLSDMLEMEDSMMEEKPISDDSAAADYPIDPDFSVDDLPQLTDEFMNELEEAAKAKQTEKFYKRPRLRSHVTNRIDRSQEIPMLAVLLAFSGFLVVVSFFFIFGLRKKIGGYVRHMRQRRRNNNWNYERVLIVQPDEDEYYGD